MSELHLLARVVPMGALGGRRASRLFGRNLMVTKHLWLAVAAGFFEPLLYLLSLGVGIGKLAGPVQVDGRLVDYPAFVAPALLAASAMNGVLFDTTFNFFYKLRHARTYDAVLATPLGVGDVALGETLWALARGAVYAAAFLLLMAVMGLVGSAWAVLALPAAVLISFAFAGVGLAITTFLRSWQDFDTVQLGILSMFLFSGTFAPLGAYPGALRWAVQALPLHHGVVLLRSLCTGVVDPTLVGHALYLAVLGAAGLVVAGRRMQGLLLS